MATIKVKLQQSSTTSTEMQEIYYQITYNRKVKTIKSGLHIFANEWDKEKEEIILQKNNRMRNKELIETKEKIREELVKLNSTISKLTKEKPYYTINDIIEIYKKDSDNYNLSTFMKKIIEEKRKRNKERTADNYSTTLKSFMRFRCNKDIMIEDINSNLLIEYESYLKSKSISLNTISFYMRILRAVYNRAVENNIIKQNNPFKKVYTGIEKTTKRAIKIETIKRIKQLNLTEKPTIDFARDMFLFSLYTRGMSYIDIAYLRRDNIKNNTLTYRRRKTGKKLSIKLEPCMQEIIRKYTHKTKNDRLLPIIKDKSNEKREYENSLRLVNNRLKILGRLVNSETPLTMYVARHSWASIAKNKYISISIISEAMGHSNEKITQIYLASFENQVIDNANRIIIDDILKE